jgi:hypothetical protein
MKKKGPGEIPFSEPSFCNTDLRVLLLADLKQRQGLR